MSIPPLVCSTPPPPEQCDDDRDPEDFDIQYNLSQEEDDDGHNYNYRTYSEYLYTTSTSTTILEDIWSSNISAKTDKLCGDLLEESKNTISILPTGESSIINKIGFEDTVLEDLNLKLEDQNAEPLEECKSKFHGESLEIDRGKDPALQSIEDSDKREDLKLCAVVEDYELTVENEEKGYDQATETFIEEPIVEEDIEQSFYTNESKTDTHVEKVIKTIDETNEKSTEITESTKSVIKKDKIALAHTDLLDDDFGEFDDFQVTTNINPTATISYCDNPWNSEDSKDIDSKDFTANFDVDNINLSSQTCNSDENIANKISKPETPIHDFDDFGDFNDFKCSSNDYTENNFLKNEPSQNVPDLSLNSPESEIHLIESINNVLSSIFPPEMEDPEENLEEKIESLLNETWGHLLDTDVRQPYIVNWNNSFGQKSLLKALCIDSRNILFGPKWNNSMPKYAANLMVAPLQPKKPVTLTSTTIVDEQNVDKTRKIESGTWSDPFTCDGQEYTYAETLLLDLEHLMATLDQMAHKNSSFKISELLTNACNSEPAAAKSRPENEMNHIYSSTLTVQPIRQINLPDTHIFTPTNSETPRSKTIHYDQGPTSLVPQSSSDNCNQPDEIKSKRETTTQNLDNGEDYWEFQDFQGNKNVISSINEEVNPSKATRNDTLPQIISTYDSKILQPIKVEPITPALNWPNPGEVKETFDDFSEFISNTSWNNDYSKTNNTPDISQQTNFEERNETVEDDFETFQSAPSSKCTMNTVEKTSILTTNIDHPKHYPQHFTNSNDGSKIIQSHNSKTDQIMVMTDESLTQNILHPTRTDNFNTTKDCNIKISPALNSSESRHAKAAAAIQPSTSIANTNGSRTQQKSDQILQPLSLESYSQINWPSPGIDLQDLSRFNPVESLQALKTDATMGGSSKLSSPAHKDLHTTRTEVSEDDIWGDFVSSKPKQHQIQQKKTTMFADDDEWTDFVSSPSVKPQNGLNTISLNVHTNLNIQKNSGINKLNTMNNQLVLDIPTLNYVTPKSSNRGLYDEKHFQNL